MAYVTTQHAETAHGVFSRLGTVFFNAMVRIAERNPRYRKVQALSAMTDEQLAARGLKREDIVRHVFADVYYA